MLTKKEQLTLLELNPEQILQVAEEVALSLVDITPTSAPMNEVAALNAIELARITPVVIKLWEEKLSEPKKD